MPERHTTGREIETLSTTSTKVEHKNYITIPLIGHNISHLIYEYNSTYYSL